MQQLTVVDAATTTTAINSCRSPGASPRSVVAARQPGGGAVALRRRLAQWPRIFRRKPSTEVVAWNVALTAALPIASPHAFNLAKETLANNARISIGGPICPPNRRPHTERTSLFTKHARKYNRAGSRGYSAGVAACAHTPTPSFADTARI